MDAIIAFLPGPAIWAFGIIYSCFHTLESAASKQRRENVYNWLHRMSELEERKRWEENFLVDFEWCFSPFTLSRRRILSSFVGYAIVTAFFVFWFLYRGFVRWPDLVVGEPVHIAFVQVPFWSFILASVAITFISIAKSHKITRVIATRHTSSVFLLGATMDFVLTGALLGLALIGIAIVTGAVWNMNQMRDLIVDASRDAISIISSAWTNGGAAVTIPLVHLAFVIAPFIIAIWIFFYATAGTTLIWLSQSGLIARIGSYVPMFDEKEHAIRNLGVIMGLFVAVFVVALNAVLAA